MDLQLRGLCLLFLMLPASGLAQEAATDAKASAGVEATEIDELEPSLGSDDLDQMESGPAEDPEPAVLTADVRRTQTGSTVMDEIDLERTEITGNQELPKVMYIVPWRKSGPGELLGRPVNTLLDEVLAPIDRTEFVREVDYYEDLHGTGNEG